ncbi:uncharacterized protein LOC117433239 [Acipenser ruthenus]|uniref:uncharacterized protein LOC117433239 n=1 Tax=Acipenser ruthenus TaxID=7906 RepID=UPI001560AE67|nr:uncharacterized protein LOC117433239 [Acipenser ruthenus]
MGILFSSIYKSLYGVQARILMLGLDAAGKTTILYKLKLNEAISTIPTIGFNVETVEPMRGVSFTVWDVGGQGKIRALWKHYYTNAEGLLFVVDSSDPERFDEARGELEGILSHDEMSKVPFVILANKQDLPGARSPADLAEAMGLSKQRGHEWQVQGCCAVNGEGIVEGIQRLTEMVKQFQKTRILTGTFS